MRHHYFERLRSTFGAVDRRAELGDYVFDRLSHLFRCLFLYRIHLYRLCPSLLWACPWIFLSLLVQGLYEGAQGDASVEKISDGQ